jgi:hypothetical protein
MLAPAPEAAEGLTNGQSFGGLVLAIGRLVWTPNVIAPTHAGIGRTIGMVVQVLIGSDPDNRSGPATCYG